MQDILNKKAPKCWRGWIKFKTFFEAADALAQGDKNPSGELLTTWAAAAQKIEDAGEELFVIQLPKERAYEILFEVQKLIDSGK